jgi:hypothetical protein
MTKKPLESVNESVGEIDLAELDSREIAKLDRGSLEKLLADLDAKQCRIKSENNDRQTAIASMQFEVNRQGAELPQIGYFATIAQQVLTRLETESQLLQDVKDLRPLCDRINQMSRQLYDLLGEYLSEVDRVEKLQKGTDFRAEFILNVQPGNLPVVEHAQGSNRFELRSIDGASRQRQNRTGPFQAEDFGFSDHVYRPS